MNHSTAPVSQTRSFVTMFLIEMWERFGYYGMQALILYYFVQRLNFSDTRANLTWSAATALIYVAPAVGGWVGDKIFGTRRTTILGAIILAIGYGMMAVPTTNVSFLLLAIGVLVVGNGLFKANAGNMVRKIYEGEDSKLDSAFTWFYMAVNLGAAFAQVLTPLIKNSVNASLGHGYGWHTAFALSCVILVVAVITYLVQHKTLSHIGSEPDHQPLHFGKLGLILLGGVVVVFVSMFVLDHQTVAKAFVFAAFLVMIGIFAYMIATGQKHERAGLIAAVILTVQTMFFFIFYQQMLTSLNLFALRNVDYSFGIFGLHLFDWSPAQFQALNPIWIFILSPVLAIIYTKAGKSGKDLPIAAKFTLGFAVVALSFFVYASAGHFMVEPGKASSWVMVWGYGLGSLGELLISGLGLAMIARFVPARVGGLLMGAYYVATAITQYLGGIVASLASVPNKIQGMVTNTTDPVVAKVQAAYPTIMSMKLEDFRAWLHGTGGSQEIATQAHLPAFSSLPQQTQALLSHFNEFLQTTTMPIYTSLFFHLALAAVGLAIIALILVPVLGKLAKQHAAQAHLREAG